jgi:toxin secretion/phage lysis holin
MNKVKAIFIAFFTALAGWLGILAIPVLILVLSNLIDYVTGLVASKYRDRKINSYKSFRGIVKKICMWLLVAVGALFDWLIIYAGETVGVSIPVAFLIACVVAIWLITNEFISILENMKDIGVPIPPFLQPLVKNVQKQVEEKTKIKSEGDTDVD